MEGANKSAAEGAPRSPPDAPLIALCVPRSKCVRLLMMRRPTDPKVPLVKRALIFSILSNR